MGFISRGFRGRRKADAPAGRIPPGQYVTPDFPVLLRPDRLRRLPTGPRVYFSSLRWLQPAS